MPNTPELSEPTDAASVRVSRNQRAPHAAQGELRVRAIRTQVQRTSADLLYREAAASDYQQIAALERRHGLQTKPREEWLSLWRDNPAYQKHAHWPIGWVIENREGQITGYFGNVPLAYAFHKRKIVAATGRALVADPDYRGYAPSLVRRFIQQEGADLIINSSCNAASAPIHEALRFSRMPAGIWDRATFWITDYPGFVSSMMRKKALPRALGFALVPPFWLKQTLASRRPQIRCELSVGTHFDERFDEFWEELWHTRSRELLADRSRANLTWHFQHALLRDAAWVVSLNHGSKLAAYAIFVRQDNPEFGLKRIRLVDFQSRTGNPAVLESMLAWALEHCRRRGIHMLETFGLRPDKQEVIDRFSSLRRSLPAWLYYYKTRLEDLAGQLQGPAVWDPSLLDGDITL